MFVILTDSAVSLLSVTIILNATSAVTSNPMFSRQPVLKITYKNSTPLPDEAGKGLQFKGGRNLVNAALREQFNMEQKFEGEILSMALYTVEHLNKEEDEMNLVKVVGSPYSFYMKKIADYAYQVLEESQ